MITALEILLRVVKEIHVVTKDIYPCRLVVGEGAASVHLPDY